MSDGKVQRNADGKRQRNPATGKRRRNSSTVTECCCGDACPCAIDDSKSGCETDLTPTSFLVQFRDMSMCEVACGCAGPIDAHDLDFCTKFQNFGLDQDFSVPLVPASGFTDWWKLDVNPPRDWIVDYYSFPDQAGCDAAYASPVTNEIVTVEVVGDIDPLSRPHVSVGWTAETAMATRVMFSPVTDAPGNVVDTPRSRASLCCDQIRIENDPNEIPEEDCDWNLGGATWGGYALLTPCGTPPAP